MFDSTRKHLNVIKISQSGKQVVSRGPKIHIYNPGIRIRIRIQAQLAIFMFRMAAWILTSWFSQIAGLKPTQDV